MDAAETRLRAAGCPKINLQIRWGSADVVVFYRALGYLEDEVVSMGKRLEADGSEGDSEGDRDGAEASSFKRRRERGP
jgi:hypothetical protein